MFDSNIIRNNKSVNKLTEMPKTKTTYSKYKAVRLSDKGNQMLASLWRLDQSDSEAQYIRDAIVFYMKETMPKELVSYWENENVPEIADYEKSKSQGAVKKTREKTQKYLEKRVTGEIEYSKVSQAEKKKIYELFKKKKK